MKQLIADQGRGKTGTGFRLFVLLLSLLLTAFFTSSVFAGTKGGSVTVSTNKTSAAPGDLVTFTVKYNANSATILTSAGVILQWDANVFALDASSSLGTIDDNDPHGTAYLDGKYGNVQNNDNNRLTVTTSGSSDLLELRLSNEDKSGDPLYGVTGKAYVNDTRTSSYNEQGKTISGYQLFTVTLKVKSGISAGHYIVTGKVISVSDDAGSKPSDYTVGTQTITITVPEITITTGDGQSAVIGTSPAKLLSVTLANGSVKESGVDVTFKTSSGTFANGKNTQTIKTGSNGVATASKLTVGNTPGPVNVTVSATNYASKTFKLTAVPGAAAKITKTNNAQSAVVGTTLPNPFTITVKDNAGNLVAKDTSVSFAVTSGGGSIDITTAKTDANGQAHTSLTLGTTAGTNEVTATVGSITAIFTATGTAAAKSKITLTPAADQVSSTSAVSVKITAKITDKYGNVVPTAADAVTFITDNTTYGTFADNTAVSASNGVATKTLTTKNTGGGPNVITITAKTTSLASGTTTVTTVPFALKKTVVNLLTSESYKFSLTGGIAPTWKLNTAAKGSMSATGKTGGTYTASTKEGTDTLTVSDTISGSHVSSVATIRVYTPITTSVTSATGLAVGSTMPLIISGGNSSSYTYTSSNTAIGTVAADGKVTAVKAGTFKVTVTDGLSYDGKTKTNSAATATIEVVNPITIATNTVYLDTKSNNNAAISANGGKGGYLYKSSNNKVATVNAAGKITAAGAGTASIIVTDGTYSNITATVTVRVAMPLSVKNGSTALTAANVPEVSSGSEMILTPVGGTNSYTMQVTQNPDSTNPATIKDNSDGTFTFTPPTKGGFAGQYKLQLTDKTSGLADEITISVPLKIESSKYNIRQSDKTQTATVSGAANGDSIIFTVLNSSKAEDTNGAIATVDKDKNAPATAAANQAVTTITPTNDSLTSPARFTIKAMDTSNAALAAVESKTMAVIPEMTYSGIIVDGNGSPVSGVKVEALLTYNKNQGAPYTVTSGADGSFDISLPYVSQGVNFRVSKSGYITADMTGSKYKQSGNTANTTTFTMTLATGSIAGTVNVSNAPTDDVYGKVNAYYTDTKGSLILGGSADFIIFHNTKSTNFTLDLDNSRTYTKIISSAKNYKSALDDNSKAGFDISKSNISGRSLSLVVADTYNVTVASGPVFTFSKSGTDISTYTATAQDSDGTDVSPSLTKKGSALVVTFSTDQNLTVYLKNGSTVVFVYTYTKGQQAQVNKGNQFTEAVDLQTGFDSSFTGNSLNPVLRNILINLTPNGINPSAIVGGGGKTGVKTSTLEFKIINDDSKNGKNEKSKATGHQVMMVKLNIIKQDGTIATSADINKALKKITITMPFDPAVVHPGDFKAGRYLIYFAPTLAAYQSNPSRLPVADILNADFINSTVTFKVDHLTVFGSGAASSSGTTASASGGSDSRCFIATAAFGSYQEAHVQLIRKFRDNYLLTNELGRAFVHAYYNYSPPMARWIRGHAMARSLVRVMLLPLFMLSWFLVQASLALQLAVVLGVLGLAFGMLHAYRVRRTVTDLG